jgi:hypothetical protein
MKAAQPPANQFIPQLSQSAELALWQRVNYLLNELGSLKAQLAQAKFGEGQIKGLQTQVAAASDALTQLQTFVGKGQTQFVSTNDALAASGVGMTISGSTGSGTISITNAGTFRSALGLGTMALANAGVAVSNSPVVASVGYVQAELASLVTSFNALATSLRNAGHIAP